MSSANRVLKISRSREELERKTLPGTLKRITSSSSHSVSTLRLFFEWPKDPDDGVEGDDTT